MSKGVLVFYSSALQAWVPHILQEGGVTRVCLGAGCTASIEVAMAWQREGESKRVSRRNREARGSKGRHWLACNADKGERGICACSPTGSHGRETREG
jgi:hypothetical protein